MLKSCLVVDSYVYWYSFILFYNLYFCLKFFEFKYIVDQKYWGYLEL